MAVISAAKPMFAPMKKTVGTDKKVYEAPLAVGKLIGVEVKPQYKSGTLYADDSVAEEKKVFNYADVILNTSTLPFACAGVMFGWMDQNVKDDDEIVETIYDESQYGGFGYIYGEVVDSQTSYIGVFLPKVKFDLPEEKYETQGENINFQTPTINGKAYVNSAGEWRYREKFGTMGEAIQYLTNKTTTFATMGDETGETFPIELDEPENTTE